MLPVTVFEVPCVWKPTSLERRVMSDGSDFRLGSLGIASTGLL